MGYKVSPHTCDGTIIVIMKPSFGLRECACAASGPVIPSKAIADTWDSIDMLATFEDPSDETAAVPTSRSPNTSSQASGQRRSDPSSSSTSSSSSSSASEDGVGNVTSTGHELT